MKNITIAIPTYNSAHSIWGVIEKLPIQGLKEINLIIADNGSADGTYEGLEAAKKNGWFKRFNSIEIIQCGHINGDKMVNIGYMRKKISDVLDSEYVFWLDSDVILPPFGISIILDELKKDKKLGMIGIAYEPNADHVQMGATAMRVKDAKKTHWIYTAQKCDCRYCIEQLTEQGLSTKYHDNLMARHLKFI